MYETRIANHVGLKSAAVVCLLTAVLVIGLRCTYPVVLAYLVPSGFGFQSIAPKVYVESGMSLQRRTVVLKELEASRSRISQFYGTMQSDPRVFVCENEDCYSRLGGGRSKGMAIFSMVLFVSLPGANETILTHELSHIELHSRVGILNRFRGAIPAWFDEGVAVLASDDPRYLTTSSASDRCRIEPDGDLPNTRSAWIEEAESRNLYAKAACKVNRWVQAHGGNWAVPELLGAVSKGESFDSVYRREYKTPLSRSSGAMRIEIHAGSYRISVEVMVNKKIN